MCIKLPETCLVEYVFFYINFEYIHYILYIIYYILYIIYYNIIIYYIIHFSKKVRQLEMFCWIFQVWGYLLLYVGYQF